MSATKYLLMYKNRKLGIFSLGVVNLDIEVSKFIIKRDTLNYLPLPIQIVLHFSDNYFEYYNENSIELNENGRLLLLNWLGDRTIPADRIALEKYYIKNKNNIATIIKMYAVSFTDCYWIKPVNSDIDWDHVKLYDNASVDRFEVIEQYRKQNKQYSNINYTLGGRLEKYWFIQNNTIQLAKRTTLQNEVLNIREVIASKIYEKQGIRSAARYTYIYNRNHELVGCKCNILSSEDKEIVTAYDLLSEYGLNKKDRDSITDLVQCLKRYKAHESTIDKMFTMFIVDYLITNRDRHLNNIAFLRDSESLNILDIAIFDNGSSENMEGVHPEGSLSTTINDIKDTEYKMLCSIPNIYFKKFDLSVLPTNQWIKEQINRAENISSFRKEFLYKLYKEKKKIIKGIQKYNGVTEVYLRTLTDFNKYSM